MEIVDIKGIWNIIVTDGWYQWMLRELLSERNALLNQ